MATLGLRHYQIVPDDVLLADHCLYLSMRIRSKRFLEGAVSTCVSWHFCFELKVVLNFMLIID